MYNGYLDIAMQIAESKEVDLDNAVGESSKYPLLIVKTLFYGMLLYALFLYLKSKFRKKGTDDE
ncbi:MAG: hypothetical protein Q9M40_06100 [Sulfurimonas sp.]|nr:hypothetical protein [Sulfurimonas sp.]